MRIQTPEQLKEICRIAGLDTVKVSAWETILDGEITTMYAIKGNALLRESDIKEIISGIEIAPISPLNRQSLPKTGLLAVPLIVDAHFGKRPLSGEYDAKEVYLDIVRRIAERLFVDRPDRIVFPIGSDLLHVDTAGQTTTLGTRLDTSTSNYNIAKDAISVVVSAVTLFSSIAPVDLIVLRGNHDSNSMTLLGAAFSAFFELHDNVTVNDSPGYRKYSDWGRVLICLTHGDKGNVDKLGSLVPVDVPELWGKSTYREVLCGHYHKRQKSVMLADESNGVYVVYTPSMSPADAWHDENGYVGSFRGSELRYYDRESLTASLLFKAG